MISKFPSAAIEWWLRKQGKFVGANVFIQQDEASKLYTIEKWVVDGVDKPSDEEVENIVSDYEASLASKELEKDVILTKLGITKEELAKLIS